MPEPPAERRHRLNRQDYAERFARGDSYGLLLALIVVLYLAIAFSDHQSLWGRFFVSVLLGGCCSSRSTRPTSGPAGWPSAWCSS